MQGKVAVEEHFRIPETKGSESRYPGAYWEGLSSKLLDVHDARLAEMDKTGIEIEVISLNSNAVQGVPDPAQAIALARRANDALAAAVAKRPDRFAGLAALPMQDPAAAATELQRCVRDLKFKGALVNGFSQVGAPDTAVYYDLPQYRPFWAVAERLDVPFYLHPRNPLPRDGKIYEGHPWLLGPIWAFGHETAVHALRLMASGLFDAHPRLQIVLGHMGENLPFAMWRVDNANAWIENRHSWPAKKRLSDYFRENFYITTSGNFHTPALINAMLTIGADRVMFSTDWPFENIDHAADWFDACPISENDRVKIGRENARRLFRLGN